MAIIFVLRKSRHALVFLLFLALLLAGCTATATESAEAPGAPVTTAESAPELTSVPLLPTVTLFPTATFAPINTSTPIPSPTPDCEALYQEFIATYGQDYTSCRIALRPFDDLCPRPEFLQAADYTLNIEIILDASGSMAGTVGGQSKLSIAQQTLTDFIDRLPSTGAEVALRVYGHKGSNKEADREESCRGTELLYPFQPLDKEKFKETINAFSPTGWTPIARSLRAALDDFQSVDDDAATNIVVLVSDGIETCDGDPVAMAKLLKASGLDVVVHVIGFDVNAEAAGQLQAVAEAGGGQYFDARNAQDFEKIFVQLFNLEEWINYLLCINKQRTQFELESVSKLTSARLCYTLNLTSERLDFITQLNNHEEYNACRQYLNTRFDEHDEKITEEMDRIEQWNDFFNEEMQKIDAILKELEAINPQP